MRIKKSIKRATDYFYLYNYYLLTLFNTSLFMFIIFINIMMIISSLPMWLPRAHINSENVLFPAAGGPQKPTTIGKGLKIRQSKQNHK